MKKILLLFATLTNFSILAHSQEQEHSYLDLAPCGTTPESQKALKWDFLADRTAADTILYVPMTIHNIANDSTGSFFAIGKILDAFDQLNRDYVDAKIHFYIVDILNKRNSAWNNHKTIIEGANMMFANNVPNTFNIYIVTNAAGNCGYNLPYAGIALDKSCMGAKDHTWAHELGHGFSLPHPFLGWEGKTYNGSKPTPTRVTYDYTLFKDSLIIGKTIIDTAWVELVDKSNCAIAADQICDTAPDYISNRWTCGADKKSPLTYKDPNGVPFKVDGTLIMSYSDFACQARFSPLEIAKMRSVLLTGKRKNLLSTLSKVPLNAQPLTLLSPINNATVAPTAITFEWTAAAEAEYYVLQVSRFTSFGTLEKEIVVNKPIATLDLNPGFTYYWRVQPYNSHYANVPWSDRNTLKTGSITSVQQIANLDAISVFPNPLSNNQALQVRSVCAEDMTVKMKLYTLTGQIILEQSVNLPKGENYHTLLTSTIAKGIYLLETTLGAGKNIQRIVVQ